MTAPPRAWAWDLQEMREAAFMNDPMVDDISDNACPAPTVSGFTPINLPGCCDTAPVNPEHEAVATKPRGSQKRRIPPSVAASASGPRKAANPKRTKRAKTATQLDCKDISQGLSRTKPTSFKTKAPCTKARPSFDDTPLEQDPDMRRVDGTPAESEAKRLLNNKKEQGEPSGLAAKYQAAYPISQDSTFEQATPPTPPKSDEVEPKLHHSSHFKGQDSFIERHAYQNIHVEPSIPEDLEVDDSITIRDFGAPPFTQTSPPAMQGPNPRGPLMFDDIDPFGSTSYNLFEVGPIENGDHVREDEIPMNDESLEQMTQSMVVLAEEEPLGSCLHPLDFSDDTLLADEQAEEEKSLWPEAVSDSEGVVLFDEDPTLVASDTIDAPSPAQVSSSGSCISAHITGNATPDDARPSEGSENCFNDDDLDDGLVNLMFDDTKSLQVTAPVTPAKGPSSPKLKWLSPKTYTPRKSSQLLVSPGGGPHLLPAISNGDALPFIRPPFPKAIRDRSPILGLTNRTVLRMCFRIGEALNAAAIASRTNVDAIIELYARMVSSSREASGGYKQFLQFADLFTDKPPYLSGTYAFWRGVGLWDNDSKELVGEQGRGKMVRVLGRMKKKEPVQGQGPSRPGVELIVLSIWEVDWEDVGIAKGVICPKQS